MVQSISGLDGLARAGVVARFTATKAVQLRVLLFRRQPESVAAQDCNAENYTNGELMTGAAASLHRACRVFSPLL
jgi:hypothetical protein